MAKNELAKKITAASKASVDLYRRAIIQKCIDTMWMVFCVTLNQQEHDPYGWERLERLKADFEATMMEYGVMQDSVDTDYADGKLEAAYEAIKKRRKNNV